MATKRKKDPNRRHINVMVSERVFNLLTNASKEHGINRSRVLDIVVNDGISLAMTNMFLEMIGRLQRGESDSGFLDKCKAARAQGLDLLEDRPQNEVLRMVLSTLDAEIVKLDQKWVADAIESATGKIQ